jgi:hypothetical protein
MFKDNCELDLLKLAVDNSGCVPSDGMNSLITERMGLIDDSPALRSDAVGLVVPVKDQEALLEWIREGMSVDEDCRRSMSFIAVLDVIM